MIEKYVRKSNDGSMSAALGSIQPTITVNEYMLGVGGGVAKPDERLK